MVTRFRNDHAFSLIELLIAMSILAVVAAIIVPKFLNIRAQAQDTIVAGVLDQLNSTYNQWITMGGNPNGATGIQIVKFLSSPYNVADSQREDSGGNAVAFCIDSTGVLSSTTLSLSAVADTTNTAPTTASADGFYKKNSGGALGGNLYYKTGNSLYPITYNTANPAVFSLATGGTTGSL